jgi:hypothetical protein
MPNPSETQAPEEAEDSQRQLQMSIRCLPRRSVQRFSKESLLKNESKIK